LVREGFAMALSFADATGNLFNRLGRIFAGIDFCNIFLANGDLSAGGLKSVGIFTDRIDDQFDAARQDLVKNLYPSRDAARRSMDGFKQQLAVMAREVLVQMVNDDHPLATPDLQFAMIELIRQMKAGTPQFVNANETTVSALDGTNYGTQRLIASVKGRDGINREYVENEAITVVCVADANNGLVSPGNEEWVASGVSAVGSLDWNWAKGSGSSVLLTSVAPDGPFNLIANGTMETFTVTDEPDLWTIDVGTPGTSIEMATEPHTGTNNLRFIGNGSELTSVYQVFESETGTGFILQPSTVYGVALHAKVSASATGVLEMAITDEAGVIIEDDQGVEQKVTQNMAALSVAYDTVFGFIITPKILPQGPLHFRVRMSTALSAGIELDIDDIILGEAVEAYPGGPWLFMIPGETRASIGDQHTVTITNSHAGKFQDWFQRCFDMRSLGLQLPSSVSSETIQDSLIA
jgi:hypothetical protein